MKIARAFICFLVVLIGVLSCSVTFGEPATMPTTAPEVHKVEPADEPAVKTDKKGNPEARFIKLHESFLKRGKEGKIGVLFLGDSITEFWKGSGKDVWAKTYSAYDPANFGISGDRTQHVLWRIDNGELDGISPKVVVFMLGTNNISAGNSVASITRADVKIIKEIHDKLPETKVLLLGIFPRGTNPHGTGTKDAKTPEYREKIAEINAGLAKLDDGSKTRYLDIGPKFLDADGVMSKDIMPDGLHPNAKGYQIWADAMAPLLDEMMK